MHARSARDATLVCVRHTRSRPFRLALAAVAAFALVLAALPSLPAAALAQSAGDEQYEDPLVEDGDPSGGGGGGSDGDGDGGSGTDRTGPDTPVQSPAEPADPAPAPDAADLPAGAEPLAASDSETLPRTGGAATPTAVLGLALLAAGVALRLRARTASG